MLPAIINNKLNGCIIKTALVCLQRPLCLEEVVKVDGKGLLIKTR
jgi:hypothetical protein